MPRTVPVSAAIFKRLQQQIEKGTLQPGQKLPPERGLAQQYGVARTSVREAYRELAQAGLVETRRGAHGGSFVRSTTHEPLQKMFSLMLKRSATERHALDDLRLLCEGMAARCIAMLRPRSQPVNAETGDSGRASRRRCAAPARRAEDRRRASSPRCAA